MMMIFGYSVIVAKVMIITLSTSGYLGAKTRFSIRMSPVPSDKIRDLKQTELKTLRSQEVHWLCSHCNEVAACIK
jgi:hypothetical protein